MDDLLIVSDEKSQVEQTIDYLREIYLDITVKRGKIHDYLGIRFDFRNEGEVFMSMSKYIKDIRSRCWNHRYGRYTSSLRFI